MRLSECCDALAKNPYIDLCSWCKEWATFYEEETVMRIEVDDATGEHIYKKVKIIPGDVPAVCSEETRDKRRRS
jgi:hypothetical protein